MKRILFLVIPVIIALTLIACDGQNSQLSSSESAQTSRSYVKNTNPTYQKDTNNIIIIGIENETDYSNIRASTEREKYNISEVSIRCTITNYNAGRGFYFYPFPFIEKLQEKKWVRLDYQPFGLNNLVSWAYCAIEGNKTKPNSTMLTFSPQYLLDSYTQGSYRLVIFVGDKIIYAPFIVE